MRVSITAVAKVLRFMKGTKRRYYRVKPIKFEPTFLIINEEKINL